MSPVLDGPPPNGANSGPGVWLFHCHIEWHVDSGLISTFVEAPLDVQKNLKLPQDHLDACGVANIPTVGNAAANSANFLDLTGENTPPAPLPDGYVPPSFPFPLLLCSSL